MSQEFWTVEEFADWARAPVSTIYQWVHAGRAPKSYKLGRRRLFRPEDCRAWAEERADHPQPAA